MKCRIIIAIFAIQLTSSVATAVSPPTYTATILNPLGNTNAEANGVSGSRQVGGTIGSVFHALLWSGTPASVVSLHPSGFIESRAYGISDSTQVGMGGLTADRIPHALLWHGTAASVVDLNPAGFNDSVANGVSGDFQVGAGGGPATGGETHALLWNGAAASVVDLNPLGFASSSASSVSGAYQGGAGSGPATNYYSHALLWNGTSASAVDLHPDGFEESGVTALWGSTQVGLGYGPNVGDGHALLWNGTGASAIDLNPPGFVYSAAAGVANGTVVGSGYGPAIGGQTHALLWNGAVVSAVDLHSYLTGLGHSFNYSAATSIDANGNVVGVASDSTGGYAILWTPIPEPSTLALVGFAALVSLVGMPRARCHHLRTWCRLLAALAFISVVHAQCPPVASAFITSTVPVGNPGNPADQNYSSQGQFGAVPYAYRIAVHEVTNAEYAAFLMDKASSSDPYQLYNPYMDADPRGGISSMACDLFTCGSNGTGNPQWTVYYAKPNMGNKPVNYVSWVDAIRFVNYLNNGPGVYSSTETGAYTVGELDYGYQPLHPEAITRNAGATWVLPNENEWYKAAYYQPANQGGDSDGYWLSPTRSNVSAAVLATADSVGNISNPGPNVINEAGATWNGQNGNVTTVGSAGPLAASFYGTYDQGGNVQEWLESFAPGGRVQRGGSFGNGSAIGFRADQRSVFPPDFENPGVGFRVAELIPINPGDFNSDGAVDAGDYVVWRKNPGGMYTQNDYNQWRSHIGQTAGSGRALRAAESSTVAVPEPTSALLFISFAAIGLSRRAPRIPSTSCHGSETADQ